MSNVEVYGDTNQVIVDETTNTLEVVQSDTTVEVTSTGTQGIRGTIFISGNGLPTNDIGIDGDFYIDLDDSSAVYGPKVDGVWPALAIGRFSQFTQRYVHTQGFAASTWIITHQLGGHPSVTVVNSLGIVVVGTVTYNSTSEIQVDFTAPFSGIAYLT